MYLAKLWHLPFLLAQKYLFDTWMALANVYIVDNWHKEVKYQSKILFIKDQIIFIVRQSYGRGPNWTLFRIKKCK